VAQVKCVGSSQTVAAVSISFTLPLIIYFIELWWVEEKSNWRRFKLSLAGGFGAAVGTAIILTWRLE
jgi:hypothetical protein